VTGAFLRKQLVERTLHVFQEVGGADYDRTFFLSVAHLLVLQVFTDSSYLFAGAFLLVNCVVSLHSWWLVALQFDGEESFELLLEHDLLRKCERGGHVAELFLAEEIIALLDGHLLGSLHPPYIAAVCSFENRVLNQVVDIDVAVFLLSLLFHTTQPEVHSPFQTGVESKRCLP